MLKHACVHTHTHAHKFQAGEISVILSQSVHFQHQRVQYNTVKRLLATKQVSHTKTKRSLDTEGGNYPCIH